MGQVGDAAELDLVVVGDEEVAPGRRDEGGAERPTLLRPDRDVVQVRRVGREAAGAGDAALPLNRVVMFNSGVGYFEHRGDVEGDAKIDLQFRVDDINDLLKSLILEDRGGGTISTVTYGSRDPITKTLPKFRTEANYFGIFVPKGVPAEVTATLNKIWAEKISKSEALKKYASDKGAIFDPQYGEAAKKASFPAIQGAAWILQEGGKAKEPERQSDRDQIDQHAHLRLRPTRSALPTTRSEDPDMHSAAISGVTNPRTASGTARRL